MKRTILAILTIIAVTAWTGCDGDSDLATSEVYFGDLHAHSTFSDPDFVGDATPEDFYRLARDELRFDFVALSDHDAALTEEEWDEIRRTASAFNDPGRFVAFSALEWTHRWHMNTTYRHDDEEICDCIEAPQYYDHHRDLVDSHDAAGHLSHPAGIFVPIWSQVDDSLSKNVEVFNASSSEQERGFSGAIWSLRAGFRFGFLGVSDDHMTDALPPIIGNGITGCHARELTRSAILDALNDRRCYASTGQRIIVDTEIAGTPMGGVATTEIGASVPARVTIVATDVPVDIELVLNGAVVASERCEVRDCELSADVAIVDPANFLYARVTQPGNQRAWSSPVWLRATCPQGDPHCLESRLSPGGGDPESDCLAEFLYPDRAPGVTYQRSPAAVECGDGDPACDSGDTEGECSVRVGICFSVDDRRLPSCVPARASDFEVIEPEVAPVRTLAWENRQTLEAIFQAAHTASDKNPCSGITELRVPAGEERTFRFATRSSTATDQDSLTIACR